MLYSSYLDMVTVDEDYRGEIKEEWKGYGTEDIPHKTRKTLGEKLYTLFQKAIAKHSDNSSQIRVKEIIVCGSFEENEAIKHFSDLDIRFVVTEVPEQNQLIQNFLTKEYTAESNCFGYIDAQCHTDSLPPKYTRLWVQE